MKTLKNMVVVISILCFVLIFSSGTSQKAVMASSQNVQSGEVAEGEGTANLSAADLQVGNAPAAEAEDNPSVPGMGKVYIFIIINIFCSILLLVLVIMSRISILKNIKDLRADISDYTVDMNEKIYEIREIVGVISRSRQFDARNSPKQMKNPLETEWNFETAKSDKDLESYEKKNTWAPWESREILGSKNAWEARGLNNSKDPKELRDKDNEDEDSSFVSQYGKSTKPKVVQTKGELFLIEYNKYLSGEIKSQEFFNQYRPEDNIYLKVDVSNNREVLFVSDQSKGQLNVYNHSFSDDQYSIAVLNKNEMSSFSTSNIRNMLEKAFELNDIRDFVNERVTCVRPAKIKKVRENMYQIVSKGRYINT